MVTALVVPVIRGLLAAAVDEVSPWRSLIQAAYRNGVSANISGSKPATSKPTWRWWVSARHHELDYQRSRAAMGLGAKPWKMGPALFTIPMIAPSALAGGMSLGWTCWPAL